MPTNDPSTPRSGSLRLILTAVVVALNLFVMALLAYTLSEAKDTREQEVRREVETLSTLLDNNFTSSADKIDLTLREAANRLEQDLRQRGHLDDRAGAALLTDWRAWISGLARLSVVDETGTLRCEAPGAPTGDKGAFAVFEDFEIHRNTPFSGLVTSKPIIGPVTQIWQIVFSRRFNYPDGRFAGMVRASIPVSDFTHLLSQLDLGPHGVAVLRSADTGLITRYPWTQQHPWEIGAKIFSRELGAVITSGVEMATFHTDEAGFSLERIESFRRLSSVPFFLVIGKGADDYLAQWRADVIKGICVAGIFLLVTILSARLTWELFMLSESAAERSRMLLRNASDGIHILDSRGDVIDVSDSFCRMLGYDRDDIIGRNVAEWDAGEPPGEQLRRGALEIASGSGATFETRIRHRDGTLIDVEVTSRPLILDGASVLHSAARDIRDRKAAEQQILRLRDIYAALSQTNQCIVRCTGREDLFRTICDIAIRFGRFRMAWIGLVDESKRAVVPFEAAGQGIGYLEGLHVSVDPRSPLSGGPIGQTVIQQHSHVINDFLGFSEGKLWYARVAAFGFCAAAAFPLYTRGHVIGTLALYSDAANFFTPELVALLDEMALDISYALDRLELDAERRTLEFELAKLSMAVEQSPVTVVITDLDGIIQYVNPAFTETSGYSRDEALGRNPSIVSSGERPKTDYAEMWTQIKGGQPWTGRFRNRRKDGSLYWEEAVIAPVRNAEGEICQFIGIKQDITKRVEAEEGLAYLAHYDPLTNLPNRLLGRDRMERAMVAADREGSKAALMVVNIDHFKRVNDSLGHSTGDAFLKAVVERLRGGVRETDTFSRQAGDEFMIVLSSVDDSESINRVAAGLLERMVPPFSIDGIELSSSVSIGIAIFPDDGRSFDQLFRRADAAMYTAKEAGRNTYRFYADRMNADANEYLLILNNLRRALDQGEFVLHYQPQLSIATGRVVGAEALIRWQHPDLGLLSPARFISIAEDSGRIVEIGEWVLREACRQAALWRGMDDLAVAVNLSAVQFRRGGLLACVKGALDDSGFDPARLELELTESILLRDTANVLSTVKRLKSLGVKLSIDDFGTGYSSLAYLTRFDLDRLKIDQSFIREVKSDNNADTIVRTIIQLAHGLNLKTVAEGVEDAATLEIVRRYGCDDVQGFHFSRPIPAEDFAAYVRRVNGDGDVRPVAPDHR
ncbi:MAG: EAL domain-containing protein [Telmatospirillum sp.]|nr:EAL domain-containing protein [Telmatospirillum sp.]